MRRSSLHALVAVLVSLAFVAFGIWRAHRAAPTAALTAVRGRWLLPSGAALCFSFLRFAKRWRYVLDSPRPLPTRTTFRYLIIG